MKDAADAPPILHTAYRNAEQIQPRPLPWLWPQWIPAGALTLLVADPGVGKSLLAADLAARLSRASRLEKGDSLPAASPESNQNQSPPAAPSTFSTAPWPDGSLNPTAYRWPPTVVFLASQDAAEDALIGRLIAAN